MIKGITIRRELKLLFGTVLFWFVAIMAYDVFRRMGLSEMPGVTVDVTISRAENFTLSVVLSLFTGFMYYAFEHVLEKPWLKRKSIGFQMAVKILAYLLLLAAVVNFGASLFFKMYEDIIVERPEQILQNPAAWSFIIYFTLCSALFSFFKLVNEKFGSGVLWKMLLGKYQKPRVEKKIFMFLDLKSSTTIAEELGYEKYSALIQQCFYDLNEVIGQFQPKFTNMWEMKRFSVGIMKKEFDKTSAWTPTLLLGTSCTPSKNSIPRSLGLYPNLKPVYMVEN